MLLFENDFFIILGIFMRRMSLLFLLFFVNLSTYAEIYKCEQSNGTFLFSDKACAVSDKPNKSTQLEYNDSIIYLSMRDEAIPLPSALVTEFLDNIHQACVTKNSTMLMDRFSAEMRKKVQNNEFSNEAIFDNFFYVCSGVENVNREIKEAKGQILFASKMSYRSVVLCLYQADKGLDNCIGSTKIIAEDNKLKLNGY